MEDNPADVAQVRMRKPQNTLADLIMQSVISFLPEGQGAVANSLILVE